MTYGQVDLQQHCLAFIEGCTAVRDGGAWCGVPQGMVGHVAWRTLHEAREQGP